MINNTILKHMCKEGFSEDEIYGAYKLFFGTLVSVSRLKIINLLRSGKKNVSEMTDELEMDQTSVSHDLVRLKHHGFVKVSVEGRYRYYALNNETIKPIMKLIDKHMSQYCIHILRKMKKISENEKQQ
ncbi:helix-turn-helix transcriptional regulator [Candidatus Pacearchaeota archaeon]|nr:helix-turn-helix transcriptional regulator [Candidatus Pacearchaeota archaeon]